MYILQTLCTLIFVYILNVAAEVTVLKTQQVCLIFSIPLVQLIPTFKVVYDSSPKIRIRGSGFDADDHNIMLTIGATGQGPLKVDKDFLITKDADGDGLILKLLGTRK